MPARRVQLAASLLSMDMSLVMAALAAQAGGTQTQIATTIIKSNADAEKAAVLTLLGADSQGAPSLANAGAGTGGNLNVLV
jgi:hypothetical protein